MWGLEPEIMSGGLESWFWMGAMYVIMVAVLVFFIGTSGVALRIIFGCSFLFIIYIPSMFFGVKNVFIFLGVLMLLLSIGYAICWVGDKKKGIIPNGKWF